MLSTASFWYCIILLDFLVIKMSFRTSDTSEWMRMDDTYIIIYI